MDEEKYELISVTEYAKKMNISTQTVYNRIKDGLLETVNFQRGSMNGMLVKTPKDQ